MARVDAHRVVGRLEINGFYLLGSLLEGWSGCLLSSTVRFRLFLLSKLLESLHVTLELDLTVLVRLIDSLNLASEGQKKLFKRWFLNI